MPAPSNAPRPTRSRLPAANDESRGVQVVQGVLALVGTGLLVIGVPFLLLAAFGTPWPDSAPSAEMLSRPLTADTMLGVLAVVVWLAWLHFVVCLVVEAVAEVRHRGLAPRVPGGGIGTQILARRAVAAVALLAGTVGATVVPAAAASAAPAVHETSSVSASVSAHATSNDPAARVGPVVQGVATTSGDVAPRARVGELPRLGDLVEASTSDVAHGMTTYYRVQPPQGRHYDTMWDIAERYLGSGIRYKEIWDLNKGLSQGDGRSLRDADLIQPDWVLRLPNDAKGPGLKVVAHAAQDPAGLAQGIGSDASVSSASASDTVAAAMGTNGTGATAEATPSEASRAFTRWSPLFGVAGGLAVAGAWLQLRRRRASLTAPQLWALRGAAPPPDPDPGGPGPDGGRLRQEADASQAAWLDRALRSWQPGAGPYPGRVSVAASGVALAFDDGAPEQAPAGWTRAGDAVWTMARETTPQRAPGAAPYPGLVCVGSRGDGSLVMIDPEAVDGVVALGGADEVARGLAMSMAVDTATHAWADARRVTLVGFADDLGGLGAGLRRSSNVDGALEAIENTARYQRAAVRSAGLASVREARAKAPEAQEWTYQLLVCSAVPDQEQMQRLQALAADPAVSLGVVVVGSVPGAEMALSAHADGRLSAPLHGIEARAQVLDVRATKALRELYEPPPEARRVTLDQVAHTLSDEGPVERASAATVQVGVLGPVTISAPGPVDEERRPFLTELACFVALHPEGVHANRIAAALWPRGVEDGVRDSTLRQLAQWFGATNDGRPALLEEAGVWHFAPGAVDVDWNSFRACLNAAADDPARRETALRSALSLVRGRPFDDVASGRFAWLEGLTVETDMSLAVGLTAQALAEASAGRGELETARSYLARGLAMLPAGEDLWRSRLRLEAELGTGDDLTTAIGEMYAAIAEHGSPLGASAQTDTLVDELAPGYRSRVA